MVVFVHEKNSVGRAKLRRLTVRLQMTLKALADALGYSPASLSMVASGQSAGMKLIKKIEEYTDGEIAVGDWARKSSCDCAEIEMFNGLGRPRKDPGGQGKTPSATRRRLLQEARSMRGQIKKAKKSPSKSQNAASTPVSRQSAGRSRRSTKATAKRPPAG
jgi:transcriptional regulator with XRE-family HTH domain